MDRSFRIPPLLFAALVLGACSGAARQCPVAPDTSATAEGAADVPDECAIVRAVGNGMAAIECDDGRQGFVFQNGSG